MYAQTWATMYKAMAMNHLHKNVHIDSETHADKDKAHFICS